jgi:hypothetical protein
MGWWYRNQSKLNGLVTVVFGGLLLQVFAVGAEASAASIANTGALKPSPTATAKYSAAQPASHAVVRRRSMSTPSDGSLFVTRQGATRELSSQGEWADDPQATSDEVEAGWGWRRPNSLAVVGYAKPHTNGQEPIEARSDSLYWPQTSGVVGFSLVIRGH